MPRTSARAPLVTRRTHRPFIATYRLQLNAEFTLRDARARIPYLRALGISHLYLSPILAARAGSTHGYDVTDPTLVSEALGGEPAFIALAEEAHAHEMGLLLDIVPNHMGIGPDNPYWNDLLTFGMDSRYAHWFDVSWRASTRRLAGKVLVPVLGDTLEAVLARGEISVEVSASGARLRYFDHHFPLNPARLPQELTLVEQDPHAQTRLADWTRGAKGHARLTGLLAAQHYELAFWRVAQRDINYRRFFDVNDLICLRVEREDVFDATHRTVLRFVADGLVDGLRIDHIDGLLEPRRYLERLRVAVDLRRPAATEASRFPLFVEKILARGEALPSDWSVDGTTGYEFMVALDEVFISPTGFEELEAHYSGQRGAAHFPEVARQAKRRVLRGALNADVRRIAPMLATVAGRAGWPERSIADYAAVIVELTAALPVYRTYVDALSPKMNPQDRAAIGLAFERMRQYAKVDTEAASALERVLLESWEMADTSLAAQRLAFVLRWQQLTGPGAAKGVEDTALYRYAPLASRNEVGSDPGLPVRGAVQRLHERLSTSAARFPRSLNATTTHDTKRSADARSRLVALSEHATVWTRMLRQWRRRHRVHQSMVGGRLAPTRTTDHFIYQSLFGIWPAVGARSNGAAWLEDIRDRMILYMQKAVREAKVSSSWTDPDARFEQAICTFLDGVLNPSSNREFHRVMDQLIARIAPQGDWNALARLVIHLTAPGTPDIYQGDELWFAALVDPDNRRPVDWTLRELMLHDTARAVTTVDRRKEALRHWRAAPMADALKMYVMRQLLSFRHAHSTLLSEGRYEPVQATGEHADLVVAFRRVLGDTEAIVIVSRLTGTLDSPPVGEAWGDTTLNTGSARPGTWKSVLGASTVEGRQGRVDLAEVLADLPVAVLERTGQLPAS